MLTCIDVKFIFDSVRLGLSSSANILQVLLFLPCFLPSFRLVPAAVFVLETNEMSAFFFTTKTTQPRLQVFSVTAP